MTRINVLVTVDEKDETKAGKFEHKGIAAVVRKPSLELAKGEVVAQFL